MREGLLFRRAASHFFFYVKNLTKKRAEFFQDCCHVSGIFQERTVQGILRKKSQQRPRGLFAPNCCLWTSPLPLPRSIYLAWVGDSILPGKRSTWALSLSPRYGQWVPVVMVLLSFIFQGMVWGSDRARAVQMSNVRVYIRTDGQTRDNWIFDGFARVPLARRSSANI